METIIRTIAAIATTLGVLIALRTSYQANRRHDAAEAEKLAAQQATAREQTLYQVERFAFWRTSTETRYEGGGYSLDVELSVMNASDLPIFDVKIPFSVWDGDFTTVKKEIGTLFPGQTVVIGVPGEHEQIDGGYRVTMRDNAGRHWARRLNGFIEGPFTSAAD